MQHRATKRQTKPQPSNRKKPSPGTNGAGRWSKRPGENLSLLLSRVRAAQVMRLHFR
jgi:hypothetical protein